MSENNPINLPRDNFEEDFNVWEGDLWNRKRLGVQLTNYVDRLQCGAVLALDARWGEGKTWFVRNWQKHLETTEPYKHNVIYLDAFANDYLDDPFLVVTSEITNILSKDKSTKRKVKKLIDLSASVGSALLPSLPKVALTLGLHLVGVGLLSGALQQGYENAKDEIDKLSDEASDRIKESIQEKIAGHEAEKKTLSEFKKHLAETVAKLDKPLVFIIDELDRCRPDFAIRLIERIKHFFDIKNIVFVLVMDKTQFSKVVCHNYGYDEKLGEEYLDKFIDFTIKLKKETLQYIEQQDRIKGYFYELGFEDEKEVHAYVRDIEMYANFKQFSIRVIRKNINQFALLYQKQTIKNPLILFFIFFKDELEKVESNDDLIKLLVSPINADKQYGVNLDLMNNQFTYYQITANSNSLGRYSILHFVFGVLKRRYNQEKDFDFLNKFYDSCPMHLTSDEKYYQVWKEYIVSHI